MTFNFWIAQRKIFSLSFKCLSVISRTLNLYLGGSATLYRNYLSHMALSCGVVIFNVDYRLAPEARFLCME